MRLIFILLFLPVFCYSQITGITKNGGIGNDNIPYTLDSFLIDGCSNFNSACADWVKQISVTPDINTTYPGNMYLSFTSGNQSVKVDNLLTTGTGADYLVKIKMKSIDGRISKLVLGYFNSSDVEDNAFFITDTIYHTYYISLRNYSQIYFAIGVPSANNEGYDLLVDYIQVYEINDLYETKERALSNRYSKEINVSEFLSTATRSGQNAFKLGVWGNSLFANYYGGVSIKEILKENAPRLTWNNMPRWIYDTLNWNKPIWRRTDHADWIHSDSSGLGDDWTDYDGDAYLQPHAPPGNYPTSYNNFTYTQQPRAYIEIVIPDTFENAVICYVKDDSFKGQFFDTAIVTINSINPGVKGDSLLYGYVDLFGASSWGIPFNWAEYNNVAGDTIRITKDNDSNTFMLWGVGYWNDSTLIVGNVAHGGLEFNQFNVSFAYEILYPNYDAVIMEYPHFNQLSHNRSVNTSQQDFERAVNLLRSYNLDFAFVTSHPWGCNSGCVTNYYTTYDNPDLWDLDCRIKTICRIQNIPFVNCIEYFNGLILNVGGTLEGGQAGTTYTTDGMHPNTLCKNTWKHFIYRLFQGKLQE